MVAEGSNSLSQERNVMLVPLAFMQEATVSCPLNVVCICGPTMDGINGQTWSGPP